MITSKTNPQVKEIKKLLTSAKRRSEEGLFVVEGARMVEEVPDALLKTIYVSEGFMRRRKDLAGVNLQEILKGDKVEVVTEDVYSALTDTVTPQGIMAIVKWPEYSLEKIIRNCRRNAENLQCGNAAGAQREITDVQIENKNNKTAAFRGDKTDSYKIKLVLLDDIRDPGNLGTIVRTSEAAGVTAIIMSPGCVDIYNPKVIRSTMGSVFRVPFVTAELPDAILELKKSGVKIFGAALEASVDYKKADYGSMNGFVIGNEANGISEKVLKLTNQNVKIPMRGQVESLNAAISLAVLLFR